jgi:hypothetical protein
MFTKRYLCLVTTQLMFNMYRLIRLQTTSPLKASGVRHYQKPLNTGRVNRHSLISIYCTSSKFYVVWSNPLDPFFPVISGLSFRKVFANILPMYLFINKKNICIQLPQIFLKFLKRYIGKK